MRAPPPSPRSAASPFCSIISESARPRPGAARSFLGHPRGLAILACTEGWIGFSWYGMQSLLVLYLSNRLLQPGHGGQVLGLPELRSGLRLLYGSDLQGGRLAAAITGLFAALIYATPIAGGLLADRGLGRTRTILLGLALMTLGHLLMGFEAAFVLALACLAAGAGCAGSLKAQVGGLYGPDDPKRADGYQIFTAAVSLAVIGAPLVCGTLGERVGWRWGFAAAASGMLVGMAVYAAQRRTLPPDPLRHARLSADAARLTRADGRRLCALGGLLVVLAMASLGNMEIYNGYLTWAERGYALAWDGHAMPVTWLLSLDALLGLAALLLSVLFWRGWAQRYGSQPSELTKMAWGATLLALAPLLLALACWRAEHVPGGAGKVGLGWALGFHLLDDVGFANLYAVGLALFSRLAPPRLGATVVNAYALHLFGANLMVGWLAGQLGRMPASRFWLLHAGLVASAALALWAAAGAAALSRAS